MILKIGDSVPLRVTHAYLKIFIPVMGWPVYMMGKVNFQPVGQTEISVTGPARLLIIFILLEHIANFTEEIGVRRDLTYQAKQVNRAYRKRPPYRD